VKSIKSKIFLVIFLNFILIFLAIYFYKINQKEKVEKIESKQEVLGVAQITPTPITNYDIEFVDLDGGPKSIRPLDCIGFDNVRSGVVSFMKETLPRDLYQSYRNTYGSNILFETRWDGTSSDMYVPKLGKGFTLRFRTPAGNGRVNFDIFTKAQRNYLSNFATRTPKYRPLLEDISGRPVMFYYGGIHEINVGRNSTYLLTRLYDSAYYSRGFDGGNVPTVVYKLGTGSNTLFFANPSQTNVNQNACYTCTQDQINNTVAGRAGGCGIWQKAYGSFSCKDNLAVSIYAPELVAPNWSSNKTLNDAFSIWSFRGNRSGYSNVRAKQRYQNNPFVDSVTIYECSGTACSPNNPTNQGASLYVQSKNSYEMPYTPGYGIEFNLSCIGKQNDNSCQEIVVSGVESDPRSTNNFTYTGFRLFTTNNTNQTFQCNSDQNKINCVVGNELLHGDRFAPYANLSRGYEIPYNTYIWDQTGCVLSEIISGRDNCVRALDWDNNGLITTYSSYRTTNTLIRNYARPANFPNSASVEFAFSSESDTYALDFNPNDGPNGSMTIFKLTLDPRFFPVKVFSQSFKYNFTAQSPMPRYYRADEISVTFSNKSEDIDLLFSSMNAPDNYGPRDLRILRIKEAMSRSVGSRMFVQDITNNFNFTGIYPLTFKKYNEYGSNGTGYPQGTEYYVFVDKNRVYHAPVPTTDICNLSLGTLSIINRHPNSLFNGLDLTPTATAQGSFNLTSSQQISCQDANGNPIANQPFTAAMVTFYDPISNARLASFTAPASAIVNSKDIYFRGVAISNFLRGFTDGEKLNFDLNFSMGNQNILINSTAFPNGVSRGFTAYTESRLGLGISQAGASLNLTNRDFNIVVSKINNNVPGTPLNINLRNASNPLSFESRVLGNFFFDHNLIRSGTGLNDTVSYQICFPNNINSFRSTSDTFITVTRNTDPKCITATYKNSAAANYSFIPQRISVNLNAVTPPELSNIEFNGNVFSKDNLPTGFMFTKTPKQFEGLYLSSQNISSNLRIKNNTRLTFDFLNSFSSTLSNFSNFDGANFTRFNYLYKYFKTADSNPLRTDQYVTLDPTQTSRSKYEIISIGTGRGILIDLSDQNLNANYDRFYLQNLDRDNTSRIIFKIDCSPQTVDQYSTMCSGLNKFHFKGSLLGSFDLIGNISPDLNNSKLITLHENPDILINLVPELRSKKYPTVTSTLVNLKYE